MNKLRTYLLEDAPSLSRRERLHAIWMTGVFLYFFLLFFQPFGVNNYDPSEKITGTLIFALSLFMGGSSSVLVLNELVVYPLFKPKRRIDQIAWFLWNYILLTGSSYIIYNILGGWHDLSWASFGEFLINFAVMCILPLVAIIVYLSNRSLRKSLSTAYQYPGKAGISNDVIRLFAENEKDALVVKIQNILYIESSDNYVEVHVLEDGIKTKSLLRQSLKRIEEQSLHPALFRCHRSFIINLLHVDRIEGNRNKLVLKLAYHESSFPVARSVIDTLLDRMGK